MKSIDSSKDSTNNHPLGAHVSNEDNWRKPKHIIFDFDGVLVDSEFLANQVEVQLKNEFGRSITLDEQMERFVGVGLRDPLMIEELKHLPANYWELVEQRVKQVYDQDLKLIDGALEILKKLRLPMCIASNSELESLLYKLGLVGIKEHFVNAAFSGGAIKKYKPDPDLFLHAAKEMGWDPKDCLVVEDSVPGVRAGVAAGMAVCGFIGGKHIRQGHSEKLIAAGAEFIVKDLRTLLRFI